MTGNNEAAGEPKGPREEKRKSPSPASEPAPHPDLLTLTIHAKTGRTVKIESVDGTGTRHELSEEERANLAKEAGNATLEAMVEQAFEAGIACVLGDGAGEDGSPEPEEDAKLRRLLLQPLIEHSTARRLMQRDVLSRAILGTLIRHAVSSPKPAPESGPAPQPPRGSARKSHQRTHSPKRVQKPATRQH